MRLTIIIAIQLTDINSFDCFDIKRKKRFLTHRDIIVLQCTCLGLSEYFSNRKEITHCKEDLFHHSCG